LTIHKARNYSYNASMQPNGNVLSLSHLESEQILS